MREQWTHVRLLFTRAKNKIKKKKPENVDVTKRGIQTLTIWYYSLSFPIPNSAYFKIFHRDTDILIYVLHISKNIFFMNICMYLSLYSWTRWYYSWWVFVTFLWDFRLYLCVFCSYFTTLYLFEKKKNKQHALQVGYQWIIKMSFILYFMLEV